MTFQIQLSNRVREALSAIDDIEEVAMFGGLCFMVNGKLCVGVMGDELLCRVHPDSIPELLEMPFVQPLDSSGKKMKNYLLVHSDACIKNADFRFWIDACLNYNPIAKSSKKKTKTTINGNLKK